MKKAFSPWGINRDHRFWKGCKLWWHKNSHATNFHFENIGKHHWKRCCGAGEVFENLQHKIVAYTTAVQPAIVVKPCKTWLNPRRIKDFNHFTRFLWSYASNCSDRCDLLPHYLITIWTAPKPERTQLEKKTENRPADKIFSTERFARLALKKCESLKL